jgi:hypothetical protein
VHVTVHTHPTPHTHSTVHRPAHSARTAHAHAHAPDVQAGRPPTCHTPQQKRLLPVPRVLADEQLQGYYRGQ